MDSEGKMVQTECKVQVDSDSRTHRSSRSVTAGLLIFTLCLAAAAAAVLLLNKHQQTPGQPEESFDLHHNLRQISNVRAAIHLKGQYNPKMKTSLEWMTQVDQTHAQGGLILEDNEVVIPHAGLYFVYSQSSFRVSCSSSEDEDQSSRPLVHLSNTVKRWTSASGYERSEDTYETILHSIRTACQKSGSDADQGGSWFTAVYMGAVFNLNRGDRLKTQMEEKMLQQLEVDPEKTFFGMFAL
ncbi:tumor necrosis factor a (TNF superfamily%2C member 2) [Xyrichtys novacula]|uniref:Tumor necrosis factor n=1 Tax=Xyrichtys novacula TaxID=13765 RepID=A0AAV1HDI2_XYRNO|nr:tumor necrosis factor a (TNF superfamily%2C member 2) [Xyrichtys novacula]